jgi:hypothetical protein
VRIALILDTHSKADNKGLEVAENHCSRFTCQQQAACSRDNANRRVNSACFPRREPLFKTARTLAKATAITWSLLFLRKFCFTGLLGQLEHFGILKPQEEKNK